MYKKILVPLDRSIKESEGVLVMAKDLLEPEGEGTLLHIIPPGAPMTVGLSYLPATQVENDERDRALRYLTDLAVRLSQSSGQWRCEVAVSSSVAEGIVDFATRERVGLIAMYTNEQTRSADLIERSVAEKVRQSAPMEVRVVLNPRELLATPSR